MRMEMFSRLAAGGVALLLVLGCERADSERTQGGAARTGAGAAEPADAHAGHDHEHGQEAGTGSDPAAASLPDGEKLDAVLQRARQVSDHLSTAILMRLMQELGQGGPVAAVRVCAEVAQELTREHAEDDLTIRRVSLKVRNAADEPDAYERAKLEEWAKELAAGRTPRESAEVVETGGAQRLRYLRPIFVAGFCLKCHGTEETIDPGVPPILAERYPDDAATGYAEGDLRGAFSVTVELGE